MPPLRLLIPLALALAPAAGLAAPVVVNNARAAAPKPAPPAEPARYPFRGTITTVFPDKATLLIKHDEIPGLMDAATMAFRVTPEDLRRVKKGQTITATLIVREDDFWLSDLKVASR